MFFVNGFFFSEHKKHRCGFSNLVNLSFYSRKGKSDMTAGIGSKLCLLQQLKLESDPMELILII